MARRPRKPRTVFKKRRNVCVSRSVDISGNQQPVVGTLSLSPRPTSPVLKTESASKKKLGNLDEKYNVYSEFNNVNIIRDLEILSNALSKAVKCAQCSSAEIEIRNPSNIGLASKLEIFCRTCKSSHHFMSSPKMQSKNFYDINVRLAYGLRAVGKGQAAAKTICGVMNLPPPPTKFLSYTELVGSCVEDVCFESMKNAVENAVLENNGLRDIPIAIDGTWQKRGFKSLNGVVTATSFDTGLVVDVATLTKYCICENKDTGNHSPSCTANYSGASGGMEVQGALDIFSRSLQTYNVRYTQYLGDGDSKGFSAIEAMCPYGNDCPVSKLECIGHIQKRMGNRLRRLKTENKGLKLEDGKTLGGQNRLSAAVIDQLQTYYGNAIRKNTNSVVSMKQAIWAIYYHKFSSDDDPKHGLCPRGESSWCKYQLAQISNTTYTHKNSIPRPILKFIKPVFESLSQSELLKRCLHGKTQNPNESVNNVIWSRLPKSGFVGVKTLHFGVYEAVASFNCGQIVKCQVLSKLGISVGKHTAQAMKEVDKERLRNSIRATSEVKKKARQKKRQTKRKLEDTEEDPDNPSYAPGMF